MITDTYKVKVILVTELLGTKSTRQVMTEHVAKKFGLEIPDDEPETLPDALERGTTVFPRDRNGQPFIWDYQLKGFLKAAATALSGHDGLPRNLHAKVEKYLFVSPRQMPLIPPNGEKRSCADLVEVFERPLRKDWAPHGPRVVLLASEMLPAGVWFTAGLTAIQAGKEEDLITERVIMDLWDYGFLGGALLQFRGGGFGKIRCEMVKE